MLVVAFFSLGEATDELVNMLPVGYKSNSFDRVTSNTFLHEIAVNDLALYWLGNFPDNIREQNAAHLLLGSPRGD
jgi:hypothetical protein